MLKRLLVHDEGVLTFEWILLLTLVVIGVIGGIAGIRDAVIHEAQGTSGAIVSLDQGYILEPPLAVGVDSLTPSNSGCTSGATLSGFQDEADWATGRLSRNQLNQVNQQLNQTSFLCPLP